VKVELGPSTGEKISDKIHMLLPALLHRPSLLASKNLAEGFWQPGLSHIYGLSILLREFLRVALDLWLCSFIVGGDQRQRSYID
jgi:hypothetical protein